MSADRPNNRYIALKEGGASPSEVYSAAKANGLTQIEALRLLRSLYCFSLAEAKEIISLVDGPLPGELPMVRSYEQLVEILREELGYCDCAPDDALALLRDFLQAARDRTEAVNDSGSFGRASRALEALLPLDAAPGIASWFVYGLEQRELISHGFRLTDVSVTPKGRWLLEAISRLWGDTAGE